MLAMTTSIEYHDSVLYQTVYRLYVMHKMHCISVPNLSLTWPDRFFRVLGGEKRVWRNSNTCLLVTHPQTLETLIGLDWPYTKEGMNNIDRIMAWL